MKKIISVCLLLLAGVCIFSSCNVRKQESYLESGVFYCDEINMEIDFEKIGRTQNCVKLYKDDDSEEDLTMLITMGGNTLSIVSQSEDGEVTYLQGTYKWTDNTFRIENDFSQVFQRKAYLFVKK